MLRELVTRYLADHHDFCQFRSIAATNFGFSGAMWEAFAQEIGILGAPFAEADGGLGGDAQDCMVILEEMGRALCVQPYLSTVVVAGTLLKLAGPSALLPAVAAGVARPVFAHLEAGSRCRPSWVTTRAVREADGWKIDGRKAAVRDAPSATHLIVTARSAGEPGDPAGLSLFILPTDTAGLTRQNFRTVDGGGAADIIFDAVQAGKETLLGAEGDALPLIEAAIDAGLAGLCAEACGIVDELHRRTLEYVRERRQFGRPIGDFQVIQHTLVDMLIEVEEARSMALYASVSLGKPAAERGAAASAAKVRVSRALTMCGETAIQLHGGIGLSDELAVGHYFKRATMIAAMLGGAEDHLARLEQKMDATL